MDLNVAGRRVFAATGGRPFAAGQPAIVFLHGAGMDHTVWALQTRFFAYRGYNVLALDLPGHGRSEGPALESVDQIADWVVAVLDALELEQAAVVGHSMGALVALDMAARHPARVCALALLGVAGRMPVHPDLLAAAAANDPLAFDLVTSWAHGATGHLGGNRAPGLWLLGGGEALLQSGPAGALSKDLIACNAYEDAVERAAQVASPCLLVLADQDRMTPAKAGAKLAAAIAGARSTVIADCGHMMMTEKPDATLDALKEFL